MEHLWHLLTHGTGSMWSDWAREYLLRSRGLWHTTQPGMCSWVWRHLLSLRHLMLPLTAWRMGDRSRISFWKDSWAEGRTITSIVGDSFIKKTGINPDISVREFYFHHIWVNFIEGREDPIGRKCRPLLLRLLSHSPQQVGFKDDSVDSLIWRPNQLGNFSTKSAWEAIRARSPAVHRSPLVWYKGAIPRLSLLVWMVILDRLPTKDRLSRMGLAQDLLCSLYNTEFETTLHLFFSCRYSQEVWHLIMKDATRIPLYHGKH